MSELKPCPFCGSAAGVYTDMYEDFDGTMLYDHYVRCKRASCPVQPSTKPAETIDEAIEAWNRRTNDV